MKKQTLPYLFLAYCLFITGCRPDERPPLHIPDVYDDSNFYLYATEELQVLHQFMALMAEAKKGRTTEKLVELNILNGYYTAGSPSLRDYSTAYYVNRMQGPTGWMSELSKASGNLWRPGTVSESGGFYAGYLFNKNGLEPEQVIEKGMYGAALFNHFLNLAKGEISLETVDRMLASFGASPEFANSYQAKFHANPDVFCASLAASRDKNDGQGLYTRIRDNFIKLQAAVKAGADYKKDRDEAILAIKDSWEKAHFATVVYYCNEAIGLLTKTNTTDAEKARALHVLSICVGCIHGWRILPDNHKRIAEYIIDDMLLQLNAPAENACSIWLYVTDPANQISNLSKIVKTIEDIYGFTPADMQDFKENWVSKQNR